VKEFVEFELTKEFRDRFQEALDQGDKAFILESLADVNPVEITALLYEFTPEESKFTLDILPVELRAAIIKDLDSDTRKTFLKVYVPAEISEIINLLDSDDAADILNELPIKVSEEVLAGLDPVVHAQVIDLLRYDENVAGGLMAKELIKVRNHWSVVQCVDEIRKQAEQVEKFYTVFVVDENDKLLGKVALQDLVISGPNKLVADLIEQDIASVETYMPDTEVADIMKKYDLDHTSG
jgi:magnesium transporter